jgi:hypothetical protein
MTQKGGPKSYAEGDIRRDGRFGYPRVAVHLGWETFRYEFSNCPALRLGNRLAGHINRIKGLDDILAMGTQQSYIDAQQSIIPNARVVAVSAGSISTYGVSHTRVRQVEVSGGEAESVWREDCDVTGYLSPVSPSKTAYLHRGSGFQYPLVSIIQ